MYALEEEKAAVMVMAEAGGMPHESNAKGDSGEETPGMAIVLFKGWPDTSLSAIGGSNEPHKQATVVRLLGNLSRQLMSGDGAAEKKTLAEGVASERMADFTDYLLRADKAEKTVKSYGFDVKKVLTVISKEFFNGAKFDGIDLSDLSTEQIKKTEQVLFKGNKSKPRTLSRLKQGWNSFCTFVDMPEWKFTTIINAAPEYKDDVISNAEVVKMLNYCQEMRNNAVTDNERIRLLRMEIAISLGWAQGLRSCEYANATFDEVESAGSITIRDSKHNGTREVLLTNEAIQTISELKTLMLESGLYPSGGRVFERPNGKSYSTSSFRRWLKKAAAACGVSPKQAKTHGLRHRFARNFHSHKTDEFMLADIMGHKSTATTRNYARATKQDQRKAIQEANNKARASILLVAA